MNDAFLKIPEVDNHPEFRQIVEIGLRVKKHHERYQIALITAVIAPMIIGQFLRVLSQNYAQLVAVYFEENSVFWIVIPIIVMLAALSIIQSVWYFRSFPFYDSNGKIERHLSARQVRQDCRYVLLLELNAYVQTWNENRENLQEIGTLARARMIIGDASSYSEKLIETPHFIEKVLIPRILESLDEDPFGSLSIMDPHAEDFRASIREAQIQRTSLIGFLIDYAR